MKLSEKLLKAKVSSKLNPPLTSSIIVLVKTFGEDISYCCKGVQ